MDTKRFTVCIDELIQNFVFADVFSDSYTKTITMSDGQTRTVKLTQVIRDERQRVQLNIDGHISYMGPYGSTTNGTLMVRIHEMPEEPHSHLQERRVPTK
jgi:hypothetical protein